MRRLAVLGGVSIALVAAAACAVSEDVSSPPHEEPEQSIPDADVREVAVGSDAPAPTRGPLCSSDGWCETLLPDPDLVVRDIWPFSDRAFAIAESFTSGIKVLEWTSSDSTWRYIDDNSQNEALADLAIGIWAPNADEVYYAVSPGTIYRGTRPVAPATAWSWSSERLPDNNPANVNHGDVTQRRLTLGVWGTGSNDVYAWYSNTIFHRKSEGGGAPAWVPELIADDFDAPDEHIFITGAAGKRPDDVWFAGSRRRGTKEPCDVLVRKTPEGYRRIADGVVPELYSDPCTAREGIPQVVGGPRAWPRKFQSLDGERFFALKSWNNFLRIEPDGDGYSVTIANVPKTLLDVPNLISLWGESEDRLWLGSTFFNSNRGVVVRGSQVWGDGGVYEYSSIALNGAPSNGPPNQIRGTSNTNLWAVGDRYAFHKTTP